MTMPHPTTVSPLNQSSLYTLPFTKMHGLGNDFVVIDSALLPPETNLNQLAQLAQYVSNRNFGIGSDGLIIVAPPSNTENAGNDVVYDTQFIFYNSDGSRAEMCGNGIRCFARYIIDQGILPLPPEGKAFQVETLAGLIKPKVHPNGLVTVDMGMPVLLPPQIPFHPGAETIPLHTYVYHLAIEEQNIPILPVSMGNPHCIIFQEDVPGNPLDPKQMGPLLEVHPQFPAKTNVEFVQVLNRNTVEVTVWERGCGFTLACGTGACATAVASILLGKTERTVEVKLPGGSLQIQWDYDIHRSAGNCAENVWPSVFMTGPAETVFKGDISVPLHYVLPAGS
jgi:diaminopimelate epimerase